MTFVSSLSPVEVWKHFDALMAIPRGSRNEVAAGEYVCALAAKAGVPFERDSAGNILVRKPASANGGKKPVTALQSHLDMVCEKNAGIKHDFQKDPIVPRREGDWLYATDTTLGADNGLGAAMMCALIESDLPDRGALELLFTTDEETGLNGAQSISSGWLTAQRLINLDGEDDDGFTIGCAGGAGVTLSLPISREPLNQAAEAFTVTVDGLRGGHSGIDIHLQRANAIVVLSRALFSISRMVPLRLSAISGGNMRNAIPREATALVLVSKGTGKEFVSLLDSRIAAMKEEFNVADPGFRGSAVAALIPSEMFSMLCSDRLLALLRALPHGVAAMSGRDPALVESSSNVASVKIENNQAAIHVSNRSSDSGAIIGLQERIVAIARLSSAAYEEVEGYPGWKPNHDSALLAAASLCYHDLFKSPPRIVSVHAGLECGIIGSKYPGMDMISFGPRIEHPHSPQERVFIPSVGKVWALVKGLLMKI